MPFNGMSEFVAALEKAGELHRIKVKVNPELEITEITDRISKAKGPALLFENNGTDFPLLINAFGSEKRMCMALGTNKLDDFAKETQKLFSLLTSKQSGFKNKIKSLFLLKQLADFFPKEKRTKGKCQEVVMKEPQLSQLPILKCWPLDAGRFITLPVVHTKHPHTGVRNVGMYRMQVFDDKTTGMHWHLHKGSARHYDEYKKLNQKMPVAVVLGGDPVYTYCASAPLPDDIDEYILAGFLRKKKVSLVKCLTQDLFVPEDADFVLEGYIDPAEELRLEGPFGDHTGFYSLADYYPQFHLTAITHRKDAVYPTTIVGVPPQEDEWFGRATERLFLPLIQKSVAPEVVDMHMPVEGVFHNLTILSLNSRYPANAFKVMNSLWGAGQMMFNKIFVCVDACDNISDYAEVARVLCTNVRSVNEVFLSKGPADVLDHSSTGFAFSGKIGFDATVKAEKPTKLNSSINKDKILNEIESVFYIDDSLLKLNIAIVFIYVKKSERNQIKNIFAKLADAAYCNDIRFFIFLSQEAETGDLRLSFWRFANNYDPQRDTLLSENPFIIGLDGTEKSLATDGFEREWPPVIKMDKSTITTIDKRWNEFGFNGFIHSPSLKINSTLKL